MQSIQSSGLIGAPLPIAYDRRQSPAQSDMPRPWLAQLTIETKAPSDYARRQIAFEHMLAAASLDDSD